MRYQKQRSVLRLLISWALAYIGFLLMGNSIGGGLAHAFSSPLLILSKIVLPLALIVLGSCGYLFALKSRSERYAAAVSRDFDAREPFSQIQTGNVPADWVIFRPSSRKVWIISLGFGLAAPAFLGLILLAESLIQPFFWPYLGIALIFLVLCLAILLPFLMRRTIRKTVLLITPDGFILGNYAKPREALRLKYRDITDIKIIGETILVFTSDEIGKRSLDTSLFALPITEIATPLLSAFARYKAEYPDGTVIAAPMFISRLERARHHT